ncbi:MAG: methyltransferase domain-containing protein [Candidatus Nezhaarchaeota archaeon]|nr:methyltransferase domain-containing protein [Candidatus Nezhaarchaeota archaeon]MCX8142277.1 methyltransferase domain-containing protein [Candidatus Nezhaarchaeota archaeon]MDW8050750.1 class I SAM-dependent methyltransferase [Nitrososphaerota archaeon]
MTEGYVEGDQEQPLDCVIKKIVTMFYENVSSKLTTKQAMRPGGLRLTREVLRIADVKPGWRILDVACGMGSTIKSLIRDFNCQAYGLDLSAKLIKKAKRSLYKPHYRCMTELVRADSELMPIREGSFDAVLCECSLSLFPNKCGALNEMIRVVKRGGKVIITDVTIRDNSIKETMDAANWCMCIAGAETLGSYLRLMEGLGLKVIYYRDVSEVYDWESSDPELKSALEGRIGYAIMIGVKP